MSTAVAAPPNTQSSVSTPSAPELPVSAPQESVSEGNSTSAPEENSKPDEEQSPKTTEVGFAGKEMVPGKVRPLVPNASVQRLVEKQLPEGFSVDKNAQQALTRSFEAFSRAIAYVAIDLTKENGRKMIAAPDIREALKECDFEYLIPVLDNCYKEWKEKEGGSTKTNIRITLKEMLDVKTIAAGKGVLKITWKGTEIVGDLTDEGVILYDGKSFQNPSSFSLYAIQKIQPERKSDHGWDTVKYGNNSFWDNSLNFYKAQAVDKIVKIRQEKKVEEQRKKAEESAAKRTAKRAAESSSSDDDSSSSDDSSSDESGDEGSERPKKRARSAEEIMEDELAEIM